MNRAPAATRHPVSILLVEDEALIRMSTADALIEAGYRVLEASAADEALLLLEARTDVRVLVTDVRMPGKLDGLALARLVGGRWPHIRIVVASGHAAPGDGAVPEGTAFVSKPYRTSMLLDRLRALAPDEGAAPAIAVGDDIAAAVETTLAPRARAAASRRTDRNEADA